VTAPSGGFRVSGGKGATRPLDLLDAWANWESDQFAWHGGFTWWHGRLAKVIERLARAWGVSFAEARARLASTIASIELVPYHSAAWRDGRWRTELRSAKLACRYVGEFILPRVLPAERWTSC
jgi:hypothetical protein